MSRDFFPLFAVHKKTGLWFLFLEVGCLSIQDFCEMQNCLNIETGRCSIPHPTQIPSHPIPSNPLIVPRCYIHLYYSVSGLKPPRTTLLKAHHRLFWDGAKASNKYFAADKSWFSWIFETNYISLRYIILVIHIILFQNI